jgi:cytochrome c oxidase assembly protein subunit 15
VGVTGTIAALSNTLFPVETFIQALADDLNPESHILVRLRGLHPLLGLSFGIGFTILVYLLSEALEERETLLKRYTFQSSVLCAMVTLAGSFTILLHAPTWMKLLHLGLIYKFWVWLGVTYHLTRFKTEPSVNSPQEPDLNPGFK